MNFNQSIKNFENRYRKEKNARAKSRLHALLLRRKKYTQPEIASIVHVSQGTVSNICRRFLKEGWNSVYDKPREGRPSRLTQEQKISLKKILSDEFFDGEIYRGWQTKDVMQVIKDKYGVKYSQRKIRDIFYEFKMSWKVPRPLHKNRDEKAVRTFKKTSRGRPCLWQSTIKLSV
jgi:transposase